MSNIFIFTRWVIIITKRLSACLMAIFLLFTALIARLSYLTSSEQLYQTAQNQGSYTLTIDSQRGKIYDTNFQLMVNTTETYIAVISPTADNAIELMSLAQADDQEKLMQKIQEGRPFLWEVDTNDIAIDGVEVYTKSERYSPQQLAKHVIGYVDSDGVNGMTGIESSYNDFLKENSSTSTVSVYVNAQQERMAGSESVINKTENDNGVVLTIDKGLQSIVESVGTQRIDKGAIVVMEVETGKIRAIASFPSYDLKNLSEAVNDSEKQPLFNRAISNYHVGSTFKAVVAAAALGDGYSPDMEFYCSGKTQLGNLDFHCSDKTAHGMLNMTNALANSCNVYFIELGQKLGGEKIKNAAADLGFGKQVVLAPSIISVAGTLPTSAQLANPADVANLSFGQGILMATPVQLTAAFAAIANGGQYYTPSLVEGFSTDGQTITEVQNTAAPVNALKPEVAQTLSEMLAQSVMDNQNANATPTMTTAAGKTSSAQTSNYDENGVEILNTWFVGYFPSDKPKYAISVFVEDGISGNLTASPIFAELADRITMYEAAGE